jgi:Rrf2 family protein
VRALCALAVAPEGRPVPSAEVARSQGIPRAFLDQILPELRRAGYVESRRGPDGGHRLLRPAWSITVADVIRVLDGPLAVVNGKRPEALGYPGPAARLQDVWIAVRASLRLVLEHTTIEAVAEDRLPEAVTALVQDPAAWRSGESATHG